MIHELKTHPGPFAVVLHGMKRYEIRRNDRGFAIGDELFLREYEPFDLPGMIQGYSGRFVRAVVTYITIGGEWGLPADLCVMSIDVRQVGTSPRGGGG